MCPEAVKNAVLSEWREWGWRAELCRAFQRDPSRTQPGCLLPGQFESILNVRGADALLAAIKSCWLSLFSERALIYLARQRVPAEKVKRGGWCAG